MLHRFQHCGYVEIHELKHSHHRAGGIGFKPLKVLQIYSLIKVKHKNVLQNVQNSFNNTELDNLNPHMPIESKELLEK